MKKDYKFFLASILLSLPLIWVGCTEDITMQEEAVLENETAEIQDSNVVTMEELSRAVAATKGFDSRSFFLSRGNSIETVYDEDGVPALYVVNFDNNEGYVVVSAQKSFYPILAKSDKGSFVDVSEAIGGVKEWKNEAISAVSASATLPEDSIADARMAWRLYEKPATINIGKATRDWHPSQLDPDTWLSLQVIFTDSLQSWQTKGYSVYTLDEFIRQYQGNTAWGNVFDDLDDYAHYSIWPEYEGAYKDLTFVVVKSDGGSRGTGDMIKTKWDQTGGFAQSFPAVGSLAHAYVGCVSVAVGQIMYKYRMPANINWNDIPLTYGNKTLSDFLYSLTSKASPDYSETGTGIKFSDMANVLKNNFNYNATVYNSYNTNTVISEVKNGRPIMVGSKLIEGGNHAWIVGGYGYYISEEYVEVWSFPDVRRFRIIKNEYKQSQSDVYYYINWGWGGSGDGAYLNLANPVPKNDNYTSNNPHSMVTMSPK